MKGSTKSARSQLCARGGAVPDTPRVWLKAFWGFDPKDEGYLRFTRPGDRGHFLAEARPGDLVLIYGALTVSSTADGPLKRWDQPREQTYAQSRS